MFWNVFFWLTVSLPSTTSNSVLTGAVDGSLAFINITNIYFKKEIFLLQASKAS
jgi:hypothetical protein